MSLSIYRDGGGMYMDSIPVGIKIENSCEEIQELLFRLSKCGDLALIKDTDGWILKSKHGLKIKS